jgi:hypothetical protein
MYKALVMFDDLQDARHRYNAGDVYPRVGLTPTPERIESLLTSKNRRGIKIIEEVVEDFMNPPVGNATDTTETKPKRGRKAKKDA